MHKKTKDVDYYRLDEALRRRGARLDEAALKLGHSATYLYKVKAIGWMNEVEIVGLESIFGIAYDEIKPLKPAPAPAPTPEKPAPALSPYDKLALENATKAIDRNATMTNAQTQAILALTEAVKRIADKADRLEQLLSDPTAMYKAIFVPVYSAVKCADAEIAEQAKSAVPRRMDGSIDYSKLRR